VASSELPPVALPAAIQALAPQARLRRLYKHAAALTAAIEADLAAKRAAQLAARKARRRALRLRREPRKPRCSICNCYVSSHGGDWANCKSNWIVGSDSAEDGERSGRWIGIPLAGPPRSKRPLA
jgi:hypothetical protein